jgi:flagellum-specific ATP synthase
MKPHRFLQRIEQADFTAALGAVTRINSEFLEADGPFASVGDFCEVETAEGGAALLAEVVSIEAALIRLVPITRPPRLDLGAKVRKARQVGDVAVGGAFAGRAVDGLGQPIDRRGAIEADARQPKAGTPLAALDRVTPREPLITGLRAIDALLPLGKGQRVGIFAASGVGKTSLIEQIARQADCDRMVMCLVGERGREVDALWRMFGETEHGSRSTLVAATADESPSMRLRAIEQAIGLAEYWRDQGEHVLLIVDSITRTAQALREIGLASGLPPTVRGLTPNVFSALPRLVERCGAARGGGAITAIFTVLSETDDVDDPVVELMKSVLDGHIVLSRSLAEKRHFPAIDVTRSVSRLADDLLAPDALDILCQAHGMIATFDEARPMIESGLYRDGASPEIDRAIALHGELGDFLRQGAREYDEWGRTRDRLAQILAGGGHV